MVKEKGGDKKTPVISLTSLRVPPDSLERGVPGGTL